MAIIRSASFLSIVTVVPPPPGFKDLACGGVNNLQERQVSTDMDPAVRCIL